VSSCIARVSRIWICAVAGVAAGVTPACADDRGREALAGIGVTYGVNYVGEVLGNPTGGFKRGTIYEGLLELYADIDFEKLAGWKGLTFHTSGYQLHGQGLTVHNVGNVNAVSNIEATPSTRLFDVWFEQALLNGKLSVRFGQLRVDYSGEFLSVGPGGLFISANFGWPSFTASNLPSGGVTYPLAAPGVRVKFQPTEPLTLLFGAYNDDPAGPCDGDPQVCNSDGLNFRITDSAFLIAEAQFKYNQDHSAFGLPGIVKVGAFKDLADFDSQRFDGTGLSLANPLSSGVPAKLSGNRGVYGILEQQIYQRPGSNGDKGITAFARIAGLPSDRNFVDGYVEAGLNVSGLVPGRPSDAFGFALTYSHISDAATALDRDTVASGAPGPIKDYELLLELTYLAQIAQGWSVQPDLQYIWHTGGNVQNVNAAPGTAIDDTLVLGLRTTINY
jgi:porin